MSEKAAPKRRGRPPLPESERKGGSNITFRARAGLRERLLQEATAAGRSISEEVERRLEATFQQDGAFERIASRSPAARSALKTSVTENESNSIDIDTIIQQTVEKTIQSLLGPLGDELEQHRRYQSYITAVRARMIALNIEVDPSLFIPFSEWKELHAPRDEHNEMKNAEAAMKNAEAAKSVKGKSRAA